MIDGLTQILDPEDRLIVFGNALPFRNMDLLEIRRPATLKGNRFVQEKRG
jgi:hypothetical protein